MHPAKASETLVSPARSRQHISAALRHELAASTPAHEWRGRHASRRVPTAGGEFYPRRGSREMVRSVAERAFVPARHLLEEFGDMMILTGRTIWSALRPPYPYGGELVSQFLFTLRLVWFPLLITTVAINYGAPGLQAANFLTLVGALDRLGGVFVRRLVRGT